MGSTFLPYEDNQQSVSETTSGWGSAIGNHLWNPFGLNPIGNKMKADAAARKQYDKEFRKAVKSRPKMTTKDLISAAKKHAVGKSGEGGLYKDLGLKMEDYNRAGLDQYEAEALRTPGSQSAWAKMAEQKQLTEQNQNLQSLQAQNAAQTQGAWSQLASRGGLSSGARERIQGAGLSSALQSQQQARSAGEAARQNIGLQDEQQRQQMLANLPNQYELYRTPAQQNAAAKLGLFGTTSGIKQDVFGQKLGAWGDLLAANAARMGA